MKKPEAFDMDSADKRIIELKLKKGEMPEKFLAKYLSTLPDVAGLAEEVPMHLERRKPAKG